MQVRTYTMAYPVFKLNISKPFTLPSPFLLWNSDCFDSTCNSNTDIYEHVVKESLEILNLR